MRGLILMTAMPPTKGHHLLIEFASQFLHDGHIDVIVCTRPGEPLDGRKRYKAIDNKFSGPEKWWYDVGVYHYDRDVPQNPSEHPDFWNVWKDVIESVTGHCQYDYVFASETYGYELAKTLGGEFIPCDINREIIDITATAIRNDMIGNFAMILPEYQQFLRKTVTIFGAESCGKTTMAKQLAKLAPGHFVPEWARGYLERDPEVNDHKMEIISRGQEAMEATAMAFKDKPFIFRDTDLFSTLGYYELYKGRGNYPDKLNSMLNKADLYIIMNDKIPFEPDILRYGGDKRESDTEYWIEIAKRFGLNYYVVRATDRSAQLREVLDVVRELFNTSNNCESVRTFIRT